MITIFRDGRWSVVLRVVNALSAEQFVTSVDTWSEGGLYSVAVDIRDYRAAERLIESLGVM